MSLHVTHVPGIVNVGADLLSRENPKGSGETDLGEILSSIRRSILIARKRTLPVILYASRTWTTGGGLTGTPLAEGEEE
jgi:hypothetical protein